MALPQHLKRGAKVGFISRKTTAIIISCFAAFAVISAATVYKISYKVVGIPVTENAVFPDEPVFKENYSLEYKNSKYIATRNIVDQKSINQKIDTVIKESSGRKAFEIYSIKNVCNYRQIAVKTKFGFIIAERSINY